MAAAAANVLYADFGGAKGGMGAAEPEAEYLPVEKLRDRFLDYLDHKQPEIDEAKLARRYYHCDQWSIDDLKKLKKRNQPKVTKNYYARKINAVVGLLERLRQDPKAAPRTPKHEKGAELATAALRYALDSQDWRSISSECGRNGANEGIAGVALELIDSDNHDPNDMDVGLDIVDPDTFFYEPRSVRRDFSDARDRGVDKWCHLDVAKEMFPEKEDELDGLLEDGADLTSNSDRDRKWFDSKTKRIRLVEHWYKHKGEWCYAFYAGNTILLEGQSPFYDEKRKTICRFIMFSAEVDHDGDRYGFFRNLQSPQDEVNARGSKAQHLLNSRRIIAKRGSLEDIEKTRRESVKSDGVVEYTGEKPEFEDLKSQTDMVGQMKFLELAEKFIDNFGPNPALIGQGVEGQSGRAIALLQQAGIAELGSFIVAFKTWKLQVYRAVFCALQRNWTAERWVRVTDDDDLAQFIEINGVDLDEYGRPSVVNALGSLDVDIILDEGPDTVNMMADTWDALQGLGPQFAAQYPDVAIELNPAIPATVKKKLLAKIAAKNQPDPVKQKAQQIALESEEAKVAETRSKTLKNTTEAMKGARDAMTPDPQSAAPSGQHPMGRPEPPAQRQMDMFGGPRGGGMADAGGGQFAAAEQYVQ